VGISKDFQIDGHLGFQFMDLLALLSENMIFFFSFSWKMVESMGIIIELNKIG
jgi:hypothetical protein